MHRSAHEVRIALGRLAEDSIAFGPPRPLRLELHEQLGVLEHWIQPTLLPNRECNKHGAVRDLLTIAHEKRTDG